MPNDCNNVKSEDNPQAVFSQMNDSIAKDICVETQCNDKSRPKSCKPLLCVPNDVDCAQAILEVTANAGLYIAKMAMEGAFFIDEKKDGRDAYEKATKLLHDLISLISSSTNLLNPATIVKLPYLAYKGYRLA